MTKTQKSLIAFGAVWLILWMMFHYFETQRTLSKPLNLSAVPQHKLPNPSPLIHYGSPSDAKSSLMFQQDSMWGIVKRVDPKNPTPNAVLYIPATGKTPTKVCVGVSCFEFIGLMGKKALFYDTNLSATKKSLSLGNGATLIKPLRIQKITSNSVTLIDSKTKTTYELSQFKIDLTSYKPKSEPSKGK